MQAFSLFLLTSLGGFSFLGLLSLRKRYRAQKLARTVSPADARLWQEIASGLFVAHDQDARSEERIERALRSGLRRLQLGCGLVTLNSATGSRVLALVTTESTAPEWLQAGREVSLALTYCGMLNAGRESLAIDFASLSDWRHHSSHRELGWETFIGTRRTLASGEYLAVGFFDWNAREQIYSKDDKVFVGQLTNWIAAIAEKSSDAALSHAQGGVSAGVAAVFGRPAQEIPVSLSKSPYV